METTTQRLSRPLFGGTLLLATLFLAGCGPKVDRMQAGLVKSGMPAAQAECFARQLGKSADTDAYNYVAELLNAGLDEKEAFNKARRKFGADIKAAADDARKACVQ